MSRKLKLLSLNVRGLRNQNKRRAIFSYLKSQRATIYCLQETYSLANDEKVWSSEWDGHIIYSRETAHSRGACILLNPNSTYHFRTIESDSQGRFVIAKIEVEEEYFFIVNIYAPNDYRDQDNFINTLSEYIISKTDTSRVIIAGDWSLTPLIELINKVVNHGKQQLIETLFLTLWMNLILLTYIDNYTQEPNPLLTSQKP